MRKFRWFNLMLICAMLAFLTAALDTSTKANFAPTTPTPLACSIDGFPTALQIVVPAPPGSSWDTAAQEMAHIFENEPTAQPVSVINISDETGGDGLSSFFEKKNDADQSLLMIDLALLTEIARTEPSVSLENATPIAALTTEWSVIVVPPESRWQTLQDLIDAFREDPTSISWGGGTIGSLDQILVGLIAQQTNVDPTKVNYVPFNNSSDALAAVLNSQVSVGVSSYSRWAEQIQAGKLRALAISANPADRATPEPDTSSARAQTSIPTLKEQGLDIVLNNWRGVIAPPNLPEDVRDCMISMIDQMHITDTWQQNIQKYGWVDYFHTGDNFESIVQQDRQRISETLKELDLAP